MFKLVSRCCKRRNWVINEHGHNILEYQPKNSVLKNVFCHNPTFLRTRTSIRNFHSSATNLTRTFVDTENVYALKTLPKLPPFIQPTNEVQKVRTVEEFNQVLNQNWRESTATEIVNAFKSVQEYSSVHDITLSDTRFDKLVDGLMDHCHELTDEELLELLQCVERLPRCESINSHNFHDVWSCLDDICCWKMSGWSLEKMFAYGEVWYLLSLGRIGDFVLEMLDRVLRKVNVLTKDHLLYTFFFYNVCRKAGVDFNLEHAVSERISEFSVEELGVIAMGFFKTKSKVKMEPILKEMIKKVTENSRTVDEITLSAIVKTIRLSQRIPLVDEMDQMLDKITEEIDRLSTIACLHIALIGTSLQYKHDASLRKATKKIVADIKNVRLKEIERILLANSMFDFDPQTTPDLYLAAFDELHRPERREEMVRYTRCVPAALNYLSIRKIYSYPLMDELLAEDYIAEVFGKYAKLLPRELFSLDNCIEIECPDYEGNRLTPDMRYKAVKWLTEFVPAYDRRYKLTVGDKFFLDIADHLKIVVGGGDVIRADHVLPHFSKADIILCKDKSTGMFIEPFGFQRYVFGDVKRPVLDENLQWYAFIALIPNLALRNTTLPLGSMVMKQRHLKAVGYSPILVPWNEFGQLSEEDKIKYLSNKLEL